MKTRHGLSRAIRTPSSTRSRLLRCLPTEWPARRADYLPSILRLSSCSLSGSASDRKKSNWYSMPARIKHAVIPLVAQICGIDNHKPLPRHDGCVWSFIDKSSLIIDLKDIEDRACSVKLRSTVKYSRAPGVTATRWSNSCHSCKFSTKLYTTTNSFQQLLRQVEISSGHYLSANAMSTVHSGRLLLEGK